MVLSRRHSPIGQSKIFDIFMYKRLLSKSSSLLRSLHLKKLLNNSAEKISLEWSSGSISSFLPIWLRDHCHCSQCRHPTSIGRSIDNHKLLENIDKLHLISLKEQDSQIIAEWEHSGVKHESLYPISFLQEYGIENLPKKFDVPTSKTVSLWDSSLKTLPTISYEESNGSDDGLLKWLSLIERFGFCLVQGVPHDSHKGSRDLIEKIGYTRKSIYGDFWEFTDDGHIEDSAYTNEHLNVHSDGTYTVDAPGLQFFHCIEGDYKGGMSFVVDGFNVSEKLRESDPDAFRFLSNTNIPFKWESKKEGIYFKNRAKIISTNEDGEVVQFRYNDIDRAPLDIVDQMSYYKSFHSLIKILQSPETEVQFKLVPGLMLCTNNWRVLHGRNSFVGKRKLIGCYLNEEDFLSRLRVLRGKKTK